PQLRGAEDCRTSVSSGGWTVVTTLDWAKTQQAHQVINEWVAAGLERRCNCHNAAIVTIEPENGQLTIYAPNRSPSNTSDPRIGGQIDQATEINQPGSAL